MYLKKIDFSKKNVLITGAGKGLGKACALAMAEAQANIIILSRTKSDLDRLENIAKKQLTCTEITQSVKVTIINLCQQTRPHF